MSYIARIRNRDGVIPDLLYRTYKAIQHFNVRPIPGLYHVLAAERHVRQNALRWIKQKFYDEPLFRLRCTQCGPGFNLVDGIPQVYGDLDLRIGTSVTMHGTTTFVAAKVICNPRMTIGDRTHCGSRFGVAVGADVTIGNDVLIADDVRIFTYDSHPLDMNKRAQNLPAEPETSRPVVIESNAWIGSRAMVMKGVRVGKGSIVAAGSIVVKDVPPLVIVAGNPARIVKRLSNQGERADIANSMLSGTKRATP